MNWNTFQFHFGAFYLPVHLACVRAASMCRLLSSYVYKTRHRQYAHVLCSDADDAIDNIEERFYAAVDGVERKVTRKWWKRESIHLAQSNQWQIFARLFVTQNTQKAKRTAAPQMQKTAGIRANRFGCVRVATPTRDIRRSGIINIRLFVWWHLSLVNGNDCSTMNGLFAI